MFTVFFYFLFNNLWSAKNPVDKKSKEDEQISAGLS